MGKVRETLAACTPTQNIGRVNELNLVLDASLSAATASTRLWGPCGGIQSCLEAFKFVEWSGPSPFLMLLIDLN